MPPLFRVDAKRILEAGPGFATPWVPTLEEPMMSQTKETRQTKGTKARALKHPRPAGHSDSEKSKLPERNDEMRKQSPADHPGKKPGEGEPSVS